MTDLVEYAAKQRWFRSKARTRTRADVVERVPLGDLEIVLLRVEYTDGAPELYQIPLDADGRDAIADPRFAAALLDAMAPGAGPLPARAIGVEQSNSSLIYGDRYIAKLYRAVEDEPSIELEMARFLSARGYRGSPKLRGALEHGQRTLAVLFDLVPNRGDAWKLALEGDAEAFVGHARLLGQRTAELHAALASDGSDPAFAPEPFDLAHQHELFVRAKAGMDKTLAMLPANHELATRGADIERALAAIVARPLTALRTRTHGDYHLGQVLWTGADFQIIDFEGEPAAPLAERRAKKSPARDVAGMLRSFDYAGATAKRDAAWVDRVSRAFLDGYGAIARSGSAGPRSTADAVRSAIDAMLVRFFAIEKALYEIAYELNNRPDWVEIPTRGLVALLQGA